MRKLFRQSSLAPPPATPRPDPSIQDLRKAIDDAAGVAGTLWFSYIFVLFYLLLAIAGVTHENQFRQDNVKLPFLQIELPMLGFFWVGPVILLLVHAYVLHHLTLLASKARKLNEVAPTTAADPERTLLGVNLFAQILAGPVDPDDRPAWWVEQVIAWVTLVIAPTLTLLYFELQFLPSHNQSTTWWARLCLIGDLALLWWLWPRANCRARASWLGAELRPWGISVMGVLTGAAVYMALLVATFPGEWLPEEFPNIPLNETLISGSRDGDRRLVQPIWPNRLFVAGIDVVDHAKYDSPAKLVMASTTKSMRGRHLEGAVILEAQLDRADFTDAHLQGASLVRARARGAWFDGADLSGAQLDDAELQGASFFAARLAGATMGGTQLQGGRLAGANLRAAWLKEARLDGASLAGADLRRATLDKAWLLGANLNEARLQAASLVETELEGASLDRAYTYRADFRHAEAGKGLRQTEPRDDHEPPCLGPPADACTAADTTDTLHDLLRTTVPDSESRALMTARLLRAFPPDKTEPWEAESKQRLGSFPSLANAGETAKVELWKRIACVGKGAPFVIEMLIDTYADQNGWTRPSTPDATKTLADLLDDEKQCSARVYTAPALEIGLRDLYLLRMPPNSLPATTTEASRASPQQTLPRPPQRQAVLPARATSYRTRRG